jgi:hypothetical protein
VPDKDKEKITGYLSREVNFAAAYMTIFIILAARIISELQ